MTHFVSVIILLPKSTKGSLPAISSAMTCYNSHDLVGVLPISVSFICTAILKSYSHTVFGFILSVFPNQTEKQGLCCSLLYLITSSVREVVIAQNMTVTDLEQAFWL